MRAIIHIGFSKTGSTSLQEGLYASRDSLLEHGILYPDLGAAQHVGLVPLFLENPENFSRSRKKDLDREGALKWGESQASSLDFQIENSSADICIISSEFLGVFNEFALNQLKAFLDQRFEEYTLVAYVRNSRDRYSSLLQEAIKCGASLDKDRLYPWIYRSLNRERLERFIKIFGIDRLKVFNFSRDALIEGDIVQDFTSRLQIPQVIGSKDKNQSLSTIHIATLLLLNQYLPKWHSDGSMNYDWLAIKSDIIEAIDNSDALEDFPKFKIRKPLWINAIVASNLDDAEWIDRTFFQNSGSYTKPIPASTDIDNRNIHYSKQEFKDHIISPLTADLTFKILLSVVEKYRHNLKELTDDHTRLKQRRNEISARKNALRDKYTELNAEREKLYLELQEMKIENARMKKIFGVKQILYIIKKIKEMQTRNTVI